MIEAERRFFVPFSFSEREITMSDQPLDVLPLWAFFLVTCLLVWGALEIGYRLGRWRHARVSDEKDSAVGVIVSSVLGLLAFLLAFTFGLAASRFEDRRKVVLHEANAIGTTYLRTRLLPEPQRTEAAALLREYVDVRVSLAATKESATSEDIKHAVARSEELHELMWSKAMSAAEKQPTVMTGLFLQSLNETIDLHSDRVFISLRSRIPLTIWIGLVALAILGLANTGYQTGLSASRRSFVLMGLVLAFGGVLTLIADLDRPREGFFRTSQEAMVDLQRSMKAR
jgi:hypothetical protein